jgi:hypothetical protein
MRSKCCIKCKEIKSLSEFHKDNKSLDGYRSNCKLCGNKRSKNYREEHKEELETYHINYRKNNRTVINKRNRQIKINHPWYYSYNRAKQRCENPNCKDYPWYGEKGIRFLLTKEECNYIWDRDKAYNMKKPSIDRKDSHKNYDLSNCQFIEKPENSAKDKRKTVLQYDLVGKFIKEWESLKQAEDILHIDARSIGSCARGEYSHAGHFLWQYKEIV